MLRGMNVRQAPWVVVSETDSAPFKPGELPDPWGLLLRHAQDALVVIDAQGHCLGASQATATLLQIPPEQLIGLRMAELLTEPEVWQCFFSQVLSQTSAQCQLILALDPPRPIQITATPHLRPQQHLLLLQELPTSPRDSSYPHPLPSIPSNPDLYPFDQSEAEQVPLPSDPIIAPLPHWRQVQQALKHSESRFRAIFEQAAVGINQADPTGRFIRANQRFCDLVGYGEAELLQMTCYQVTHPEDRDRNQSAIQEMLSGKMDSFAQEKRYLCKSGECLWARVTFSCIKDDQGAISSLAIVEDMTERKWIEQEFYSQIEREILLNTLIKDIRESLDLNDILNRTARNIQSVFQGSRGIVALWSEPDSVLIHTVAAAATGLSTTQGFLIPIAGNPHAQAVIAQEEAVAVMDVYHDPRMAATLDQTEALEIRALLSVAIRLEGEVKGILSVHQCHQPRHWTLDEQRLLHQIADHLALAIQQSELYHQVQVFNQDLEQQVVARTTQLQQALEFEATLRRLTDQVRDGLDEQQILQTVVWDLGQSLQGSRCFISFYSPQRQNAILQCEYTEDAEASAPHPALIQISDYADLYTPLQQGQMLQFCTRWLPFHRGKEHREAVLACPIRDDQEILGDIWITRPVTAYFNDLETRLVQQVANQCGIAIRQSRLYQAAQHQVQELERLNHLKDDFISTVSHELRTPLTNLRLALRLLNQSDSPAKRQQYYDMAVTECERQIALITDLLNLQRLTANRYELQWETIQLLPWLEESIHPYLLMAQSQTKTLVFHPPTELMDIQITTDRTSLTRVLQELLTNACKYTIPGDQIQITAGLQAGFAQGLNRIWIEVANPGELEQQELTLIFEKFYRVPQPDRWKHPGTGLGLALVKRLIEQMRGEIRVRSQAGWIRFILWLPQDATIRS